jgi:hypothetical protein
MVQERNVRRTLDDWTGVCPKWRRRARFLPAGFALMAMRLPVTLAARCNFIGGICGCEPDDRPQRPRRLSNKGSVSIAIRR